MNKVLKLILRILLFIICAILILNIIPATDSIAVNPFSKADRILTATQSGAGDSLPANVMAAFNSASAYDIMYFSISVIMTSDEALVVADEDDLSKYTDAKGKISEKTYEDISKLNFAYKYSSDGKTYPYRDQQFACIKLEELFTSFPYSNFIINVVQDGDKGRRASVLLCEMIRKNKLSLRTAVKGSDNVIEYIREQTNVHVLTETKGSELSAFITLNKVFLGKLCGKLEFQYVEIPIEEIKHYSKKDIKALQNRHISIFISGVDEEAELKLSEDYGADGIITNDPETIMRLLGSSADTEK